MDKVEYYGIREDIEIANKMGTFQQYIMDILEVYPILKDMTLEDAKWWFFNGNYISVVPEHDYSLKKMNIYLVM